MARTKQTGRKKAAAKQQEQGSVETTTGNVESGPPQSEPPQKQQEQKFVFKKPTLKYGVDTLISPTTNRPVKDGEKVAKPPIFWCDVCSVKLSPPMSAIAHFNGKAHSIQVNRNKGTPVTPNVQKPLKRPHPDAKSSSEPSEKVTKKDEDPGLQCTDCKCTFPNYKTATEHFKGKRHLKRMREILAPKPSPKVSTAYRGGYNSNNRYNNSSGNYSSPQPSYFNNNQNRYGSLNNQLSSYSGLNQSSVYSNSLDRSGGGYSNLNQRSSYGDLNPRSSFSGLTGIGLSGESNFRPMGGDQQSNFSSPMNSRFNLSSILPSSNNNYWRN